MADPILPGPGVIPPPMNSNQTVSMSTECLDRFARTFESSARRWELIVYPSLFAFIVLASYFFFLIYRLTADVAVMARNVSVLTSSIDRMVVDMNSLSSNINSIAMNMNDMSKNIDTVAGHTGRMSDDMRTVSGNMDDMSKKMNALEPMQASMLSMDQSTRAMAFHTDQMRYSVNGLNRGVNQGMAPMQTMSSFMPVRW